jgi:predicted Zn-dependent peptidase
MYHFEKSSNGMSGVYLVFHSVPLMETQDTFGVSHLIEHMVTDSLKQFETEYDTDCIDLNAFTGEKYVVFYITGLEECVARHKESFIKTICEYVPQEEHFKKQIGIVTQEFNDWYDGADCNAFANYMSLRHGHIFQIGTRDALENMTFEKVKQFFTENMRLNDIYEVGEKESDPNVSYYERTRPAMNKLLYTPKIAEVNKSSLPMLYGFKERDISDKEYLATIVSKMFSYGLGSPLYRIREELHLVYWVQFESTEYAGKTTSLISTSGKAKDKETIANFIKDTIENGDKFMTKGRYDTILENTKNRIRINTQSNYTWNCVSYAVDSTNMRENIGKVTFDETVSFYENQYRKQLDAFAGYDDLV